MTTFDGDGIFRGMGRKLRVEYAGAISHVMNRRNPIGANTENLIPVEQACDFREFSYRDSLFD